VLSLIILHCGTAAPAGAAQIPVGTSLEKVVISSLVTGADKVIPVPVAKTH